MQLTIQQLKTAVLEHVSADWVKQNFGKLSLKQTWIDAYDRLSETIASAADKTKAAIESEQGQAVIATGKAVAAKALSLTVDAAIWLIKAAVIVVLVVLELSQEGTIERITTKAKAVTEATRKYSSEYLQSLNRSQLVNLAKVENLPNPPHLQKSDDLRGQLASIAA